MKGLLLVSLLALGHAGNIAIQWSDCGDASTHCTVQDVQPASIAEGSPQTIHGTGTCDEGVQGGTYKFVVKAGWVTLLDHSGDICEPATMSLPFGLGSVKWEGIACPHGAGAIDIPITLTLSSNIPASLAHTTMSASATAKSGDKLVCLSTSTSPAEETWEEIVAAVNAKSPTWTAAVPGKFGSVREVKNFLGAFLPSHEEYSAPPEKEVPEVAVPSDFDSRSKWPTCGGMSHVRDQSACGSCWAFGSTDSFQDRACVATGKDVRYSPEDTAFCSNAGNGCNGGNSAWDWFRSTGVVTGGDYFDIGKGDTCLPYSLAPCAHHVPATSKYPACPSDEYPSPRCRHECSESSYSGSYSSDKVRATEAYSVRGNSKIQSEILQHGPLYCAFSVYSDFPTYKSGIYTHQHGSYLGGHAVEMMGWGTLGGGDYWLVKNSWNEQWGDGGFFKIARGSDECGIEDSVSGGLIGSSPSPSPSPSPGPSPSPSCQDASSFCGELPSSYCSFFASECQKTCGCCGSNPPSYCSADVVV